MQMFENSGESDLFNCEFISPMSVAFRVWFKYKYLRGEY